jgi:hypothetical protein
MRKHAWLVLILGVVPGACSNSSEHGYAAPAGGGGGSGSSSGEGSSGSGGSSGSSGGSLPSDAGPTYTDAAPIVIGADAAPSDADVQTVITLQTDTFTVPGGTEAFKCQQFGNPFGKDVDITTYDGQMSVGSHHFFLFTIPGTTTSPIQDCPFGGIEIHPFPYLSQSPHMIQTYPEGMGSFMPANLGYMMQVHFVNPNAQPVQASAKITLYVAKPGTVNQHVGTIFMNQTFMSVPPTPKATPVPSKGTCALPKDVNVLSSWSHMHKWGENFTASANGSTFYQTNVWSEPPVQAHNPPLFLSAGTNVTWECDYYNDTGSTLTFGETASSNVMCIYVGQYYPADPNNSSIQCILN